MTARYHSLISSNSLEKGICEWTTLTHFLLLVQNQLNTTNLVTMDISQLERIVNSKQIVIFNCISDSYLVYLSILNNCISTSVNYHKMFVQDST